MLKLAPNVKSHTDEEEEKEKKKKNKKYRKESLEDLVTKETYEEEVEEEEEEERPTLIVREESHIYKILAFILFFVSSVLILRITFQRPEQIIVDNPYDLLTEPRITTSQKLNMFGDLFALPLVASLDNSFKSHLSSSSVYSCLCMHHLNVNNIDTNYQVIFLKKSIYFSWR